jgi:hypothetical protein
MNPLVPWIWAAGAVHLGIVAGNIPLPKKLAVRTHIEKLPPMLRQVFLVHWAFILIVLLLFAGLCFGFAPELAGASALGRFLSGALAIFWLLRLGIQLFYYDAAMRRANRPADVSFALALLFLVGVFTAAALGIAQ